MRGHRLASMILVVGLVLTLSACGDDPSSISEPIDTGDTTATGDTQAATTTQAAAPTEIRILQGSSGLPEAMWIIGDELGFFEDENLELVFEPTEGSAQSVQLLIAGQGDVATTSTEAFLTGVDAGGDIQGIYQTLGAGEGVVFGMIVREDSAIQSVDELTGGTIGITGFEGGEVPVVNVMLQDAGLTFGVDVDVVPVGDQPANIIEALDSGSIDAFGGSATDFSALGGIEYPFRYLKTEHYDSFPIGGVLAVSAPFLESNRDAVVGLLRGYAKGVHVWNTVPEAAAAATQAALPESWANPEVAQFILDLLGPLYAPTSTDAYGQTDIDGWVSYIEFLKAAPPVGDPIIETDVDANTAVTNELIPELNDWDRAAVEDAARAYADAAG
ncbi:MAG: ABC transporter substrate-binding protein [Acidimicrobiia bacterium]